MGLLSTTLSVAVLCCLFSLAYGACPEGFTQYDISCYKFFWMPLTVPDSQKFCEMLHSSLAVIETEKEYAFLLDYMKDKWSRVHARVSIDGTDAYYDGEWVNFDTVKPLQFIDWAPGQPDNYKGDEGCLGIFPHSKQMEDDGCWETGSFICESAVVPDVSPELGGTVGK